MQNVPKGKNRLKSIYTAFMISNLFPMMTMYKYPKIHKKCSNANLTCLVNFVVKGLKRLKFACARLKLLGKKMNERNKSAIEAYLLTKKRKVFDQIQRTMIT